jgi:hypothetical protein
MSLEDSLEGIGWNIVRGGFVWHSESVYSWRCISKGVWGMLRRSVSYPRNNTN